MKKLILMLTVISLLGCISPPPKLDLPRIGIIGDSHTVALMGGSGATFPDKLKSHFTGRAYVINEGCGGTTAGAWSGRYTWVGISSGRCSEPSFNLMVTRLFKALPLDILVVSLGGNDAFLRAILGTPILYEQDIDNIVTQGMAWGIKEFIILVPPPQHAAQPPWSAGIPFIAEIQLLFPAICDRRPNVTCGVNLNSIITIDDYGDDNLHFKDSGHQKIFDAMFILAEEALNRL